MKSVRLGVIGVGNMGAAHCRNILSGLTPQIELVAVAERDAARRDWLAEWLPPSVQVFEEGAELITSGDMDAVLIATPHYQHPSLAMEAFARGLHVLLEKPAGVYTKAVREMNAAADRSGAVFAIMFNQRTNCLYRKMHEIMQSGVLGRFKRVTWVITNWFRTQHYYDSGAWRATWAGEGGGVLMNQCPHNLDLLQWICGMPRLVEAHCYEGKWHDIEVEDDVTAFLEFEHGATGVFITSTGESPGTNRFEISCEGGKMVAENGKLMLYRNDVSDLSFIHAATNNYDAPTVTEEEVSLDGENSQHVGVMNAFAAHIVGGAPLVADGRVGIHSVMLSNAMHLSSWLGKAVELPIDEDLFLRELDKRRETSREKTCGNTYSQTEGHYGK